MRLEHRTGKIAALVVFTIICLLVFFYLYKQAGGSVPFTSNYTVYAEVPDSFQTVENSDVRSAGVTVGKVKGISNPELQNIKVAPGQNAGRMSRVELQLTDSSVTPVYRNAHVQVRVKTLVGENYISLQPGTPSAGKVPNGGTLPVSHAGTYVQLGKILSSLDKPTRQEIRKDLDTSSLALKGKGGAINHDVIALEPAVDRGDELMKVLDGQRQQVAAVLDNAGKTFQAFADRTASVRSLAVQAKTTAVAVAARDKQLGALIDQLPATLKQAQQTVGVLGDFSANATPVVSDLRQAMPPLTSVLHDLRPAATSTRILLQRLPATLKVANPLLDRLSPFAEHLNPAAPAVDALARQAAPALGYLSRYRRDIGAYFANQGSFFVYPNNFAVGRVDIPQGPDTLAIFNPAIQKAFQALLKVVPVAIPGTGKGTKHQNYPAPGSNDQYPQPGIGKYPHVTALPPPGKTGK